MNKTHGMYGTKPHNSWRCMRDRFNPKSKDYERYGGRGITINSRWFESFEAFWEDMKDTYQDGLTIDRIENDKGYYKENCRWATNETQCNNRRSNIRCIYKGEKLTIAELARKYNIGFRLLYDRYCNMGWSIEKAIETPKQNPYKKKERLKCVLQA
jgi:hypothetical protein